MTTLKRGSSGDEVKTLQNLLNQKVPVSKLPHGRPLEIDRNFGADTEAAVMTFQSLHELTVNGEVGQQTWAALGVQFSGSGSQPTEPAATSPVNATDAPWMKIAHGEEGTSEIQGSKDNPRIVEYHATTTLHATDDETAWCSSFVNWCLKKVGIRGTDNAAAASWLKWGRTCNAQPGAITVIFDPKHPRESSGNHVSFLVKETASDYILFGGNQSNQVKQTSFSKNRWQLKGYRWPS